ncbi:hypothetical protein [Haloferula sargassicola]|uniref:Plasmid related protein n=1 Tax=Haloferula sargassicola TaxID=490096 RepID=A0ABP9URP8_9BACT
MNEPKFPLGQIVTTPAALEAIDPEDMRSSLARHAAADWGDLCEEDRTENEISLRNDLRIFSVYRDRKGVKFWIITEADRSSTCILLPTDY